MFGAMFGKRSRSGRKGAGRQGRLDEEKESPASPAASAAPQLKQDEADAQPESCDAPSQENIIAARAQVNPGGARPTVGVLGVMVNRKFAVGGLLLAEATRHHHRFSVFQAEFDGPVAPTRGLLSGEPLAAVALPVDNRRFSGDALGLPFDFSRSAPERFDAEVEEGGSQQRDHDAEGRGTRRQGDGRQGDGGVRPGDRDLLLDAWRELRFRTPPHHPRPRRRPRGCGAAATVRHSATACS